MSEYSEKDLFPGGRQKKIKEYEKQEKRLRELKASGQSKKKAESKQKEALTRKQGIFHSNFGTLLYFDCK